MEEYIYIYGINAVSEYLKREHTEIRQAWLVETNGKAKIIELLKSAHITYQTITKERMGQMVKSDKHQGVCLAIAPPQPITLGQLIAKTKNSEHALLWILDQIEDPHNVGAITRSAAQFGVDGLIMLDRRQVGFNATVVKVSAGACFSVEYCLVTNLTAAIGELKQAGYWIYATTFNDQAIDVKKMNFDTKTAVIVGNEGDGVSAKLVKHSDQQIYIPMYQRIDSLNVSVASGILMYQIRVIQKLI